MHLFELPKVEPRYFPKKRDVSMPDTSLLKSQQKIAFEGLVAYIQDDSGVVGSALLDGAAGTGKSYTISMLIEYILSDAQKSGDKHYSIACTATTNKAVKVTYRMANYYHSAIDYKTVHSLLGLREQITNDGRQIFVQDPKNPPELDTYRLLIIDESSQLDQSLFTGTDKMKGIQQYIEEGLKVIFVGDFFQIPPINQAQSIVFEADAQEIYNIKRFQLDEIVRQAADNPIIALSTEVRRKIHLPKSFRNHNGNLLWEGDKGVYFIDKNDGDGMDEFAEILEHIFLSDNFKADPDFGKIIAYHRRVVARMNDIIRKLLFEDEAEENRIMVGEKIIANTPIFDLDEDRIILPANEEMDVLSFTESVEDVNDGMFRIPYYDTLVQYYRFDNTELTKRIRIPTTEGLEIYDSLSEQMAEYARQCGKTLAGSKAWREYFEFKRAFADIAYNYSLTCHKCLPLDAKLLTPMGIQEIGRLRKGNYIISGNGNTQKILDVVYTGLKKEWYIKTRSGRTFVTSEDHKYLMSDGGYKKAQQVKVGEHISLWRSRELHDFETNDYYAYGYIVGDGCYSYKSNRVDITVMADSNVIPILKTFMGKYGSDVKTWVRKNNKAVSISVESKELREELIRVGLDRVTCQGKTVPLFTSRNDKANFIRGLMDSDGSCSADKCLIRFVNTSESIVDSLLMLLLEFGIVARKEIRPAKYSNHATSYAVSILGESVMRYMGCIGFGIDYKQARLQKVALLANGKSNTDFIPNPEIKAALISAIQTHKTKGGLGNKGQGMYANKKMNIGNMLDKRNLSYHHLYSIIKHLESRKIEVPDIVTKTWKDWYFYDEVVEVGHTGNTVPMVDIEVEFDHNFVYNGAVVHNSQGSTYKNAIVLEYDIDDNRRIKERQRIKYTAFTRPADRLFIVN